jgi:hypothetical protein
MILPNANSPFPAGGEESQTFPGLGLGGAGQASEKMAIVNPHFIGKP